MNKVKQRTISPTSSQIRYDRLQKNIRVEDGHNNQSRVWYKGRRVWDAKDPTY
jgi:hypothetical protein